MTASQKAQYLRCVPSLKNLTYAKYDQFFKDGTRLDLELFAKPSKTEIEIERRTGHLDSKSLVVAVFQKEDIVSCGFEKADFDSDFDFEKTKCKQTDVAAAWRAPV